MGIRLLSVSAVCIRGYVIIYRVFGIIELLSSSLDERIMLRGGNMVLTWLCESESKCRG